MTNPLTDSILNRRQALQTLAASAVAISSLETAHGYYANDKINVACIGTGGRCRTLMKSLREVPGVNIVAVADVRKTNLKLGQEIAGPNTEGVEDFRRLLDRKDIDAVMIGSPDHWHVPMTIAACEAGKDVYVEKPLTHTLEEGESVIQATRNNKRIVQVGTQQRSVPHLIEAREVARSGILGDVHKIHMSWNRNTQRWGTRDVKIDQSDVNWKMFLGNAPDQPYDPYKMTQWRWFWDFGGGIFTDLMVHWMDAARWMLDLPGPQYAVSMGHQFATRGLWETPDTVQTIISFGDDGPQAHFDGTFVSHYGRSELVLMGTAATLVCDRGAYQIIPQAGSKVPYKLHTDSKLTERGLDFYNDINDGGFHIQNWVDCIRSRKDPTCPVEDGVRSAAVAHMSNNALAQRHKS
jgi:predicted dehydrogenase